MAENNNTTSLSDLSISKFPLRYGMESCYITLTDDRYTEETIKLRNTAAFGKFINLVELSRQDHEHWLAGQLERDDALNFVLIAKLKFAGTLSLYNIEHGNCCELGRMMIPDDGRRIYAPSAVLLAMSFAFEILGLRSLYCVVGERNKSVLNSLLKTGWQLNARYERFQKINGEEAHLLGLSIEHSEWQQYFVKMKGLFRP